MLLEAKAAYERGLALSPSHSQGYHWYALLLSRFFLYDNTEDWFRAWKRGDFIKTIERGLAVDPLSVPLHTQARFYPGFNPSPEEAMWHARRTVEIAPDSPRGYESVGQLYWSTQGRLDEAIRWESKAARLDPKHVSFPRNIGRAYASLGDYDTALDYLARAKQLMAPDNTAEIDDFVVLDEALTRLYAGQEQQALDMLTALQRSDGLRARGTAVSFLAGREIAAGRPDLALARYQTYFPDCFDPEITDEEKKFCPWELMRVYQAIGDTGESEKWQGLFLKPGYELFIKYGYPRLGNGMGITEAAVLALEGQPEAALQVLEQAVSAGWRAFFQSWSDQDWRYYQRHDMFLDSIRDDPRFKAAFATIEADMAEQLESVREMERSGEIPEPESLADPASQ